MVNQSFVASTHNILFALEKTPDKWKEDLVKSSGSTVAITNYQEAEGEKARATIREWCVKHNRSLFHPENTGNPISWDNATFEQLVVANSKIGGVKEVHASAREMGVPAKFNPARDFTFVGLKHRATGKSVLVINVHPVSGATAPADRPGNDDSPELAAWKDWAIGQYWLDVLSFTARQMSRPDPGVEALTPFWDIILLGGDFNAATANEKQWYYPGAMLDSLYLPDTLERGLDHLMRTITSDCSVADRWKVEGNTDHSIHFCKYRILDEVQDFKP